MNAALARHNVMPKKSDDSVSPYLRKPVRSYERVMCERAEQSKQARPRHRARPTKKSETELPEGEQWPSGDCNDS